MIVYFGVNDKLSFRFFFVYCNSCTLAVSQIYDLLNSFTYANYKETSNLHCFILTTRFIIYIKGKFK